MLRNEDEDELREILSETYASNNYIDEEIGHLLQPLPEPSPMLRHLESSESLQSDSSHDSLSFSHHHHYNNESEMVQIEPFELPPRRQEAKHQELMQEQVHIFQEYYDRINSQLRAESLEIVRQQYPLFLLSQPIYQMGSQAKHSTLGFTGALLKNRIILIEVGFCEQEKAFKMAAATEEGDVIIFQPGSQKAQIILEGPSGGVSWLKWSQNMQYLAIGGINRQASIWAFKQAVSIENQISFRQLRQPVLHVQLQEKQLKMSLTQLYFLSQNPLKMLVVDLSCNMSILEMKKQLLSTKPHLTALPLQFSDFLDVSLLHLKVNGQNGTFMAVAGREVVTICLLQPQLEVALVFDKQKHGSAFRKRGYPHVSFRSNPASLCIVWDRYIEILQINVVSLHPLRHNISIIHRYYLPDTTLLAGFLSNSLLYHVTPISLKVYSIHTFPEQLDNRRVDASLYFQPLELASDRIEEVAGGMASASEIRALKGLISVSKRTLFHCGDNNFSMLYFTSLQQHIAWLVENNNWKVALELLKDCHIGVTQQFDEVHHPQLLNKIRQLSGRYVNFLETIIKPDSALPALSSIELLWNQELIFVFNILINCELELYLLDDLLPKVHRLSPAYLNNILPFLLTNKLAKITPQSLKLFIAHLPKNAVSRLLLALQPPLNDPELPHQINGQLVEGGFLLQLVDLNQKFGDHYTPLAVLVGSYLRLQQDSDRNIMQITQQKRMIGKLLAYALHQSFQAINFRRLSSQQSNEALQTILPLLNDQILPILIREEPKGLFQLILEQLYSGYCLQALNNLENSEGELMRSVAGSVSYAEVVENGCQRLYWLWIFSLVGRRLIEAQVFMGLKFLCLEDHIQRNFIERLLSKCGDQVELQLSKLSTELLKDFFSSLLKTDHVRLVVLVGKLLRRQIDVLHALLAAESQRNIGLYHFLDECIGRLGSEDLARLRAVLKQNIKLFTAIDANRAGDIICKHFLPDLHIFIDDLSEYPQQQLKLIRAVLLLHSYDETLVKLKIRYLELLAITNNHATILEELQQENYPLDESLTVCRKYDVLEAVAYLLVKSGGEGNTAAAIKVYFRIIWEQIIKFILKEDDQQKHLGRGLRDRESTSQKLDQFDTDLPPWAGQLGNIIIRNLDRCVHICLELDLKYHEHFQNEWFIILQELQSLKKTIMRSLVIDSFNCDLLNRILHFIAYPRLVRSLIAQVSHGHILQYLQSAIGNFEAETIRIMIDEMVKNYLFDKRMFKVAQELFIETETTLRSALVKEELAGFRTEAVCAICQGKGELVVRYGCGHEIHPGCGQDVKQCILCSGLTESMYRKKIDNLTKLRVDIYSAGVAGCLMQVQQQMSREDKLRRFNLFDEICDFTADY